MDEYTGPVRVGVIYLDHASRKASLPLDLRSADGKSTWIKGKFFDVVLEDYSLQRLLRIDPKLIVLAPFTVPKKTSKEEVKYLGQKWKTQAHQNFPPGEIDTAINVLTLFVLNRFRIFNREEVMRMLHLDLATTEAGKDLIQIGEIKGEKKGKKDGKKEGEKDGEIKILMKQLKKRFGTIPKWAKEKLEKAKPQKLESWGLKLLDAQTLEEVLQ